ncbi:MAG: DUF333 domain-containing protein [Neisseria sp.]|nr:MULTISPECIES: DUF333 domain-containing protein [unclassified Neisseria]MBF1271074.1 DUF333 domain-containing protein [Neisseria sp.]
MAQDRNDNEIDLCHLPDGRAFEEWEYSHQHNK